MLPTAMLGAFAADNRKEAEPVKLRVGSYNIHNGSDMKHDFSILAEEILRARLDVIGLQEVDRGTNRSKKQDTVEMLVKALKEMTGSDSWYGYFTLATGMDGGQYGTAIISKYELKNTETVKLPHTSGYEQRSYGHAEITVGGRTVHLYNTHLEWPNANDRAKQIVVMGEEISKRDCAILTGDLNIGARREYQPKFPLCNFANGGDDDHTFMTLEDGAIDNIISTKNTILRKNSGMIKTSSSDHNLLWAELCIKPEANFRAEDGKIYYYADGETAPAKGKVTIDGNTMYFDETTGAMRTGTVQDGEKTVTTEEFKAAGLTLSRAPRPKDDVAPEQRTLHKEVTGTKITGFNGKDYTKELTDNDYGTNIDYTFHWYEKPEVSGGLSKTARW